MWILVFNWKSKPEKHELKLTLRRVLLCKGLEVIENILSTPLVSFNCISLLVGGASSSCPMILLVSLSWVFIEAESISLTSSIINLRMRRLAIFFSFSWTGASSRVLSSFPFWLLFGDSSSVGLTVWSSNRFGTQPSIGLVTSIVLSMSSKPRLLDGWSKSTLKEFIWFPTA